MDNDIKKPVASDTYLRAMRAGRPLWQTLALVAGVMLSGMFLYELSKELFLPELTKWQSHWVTICVSMVVATVTAWFVRHNLEVRNIELRKLVIRKETLEDELRATIGDLRDAVDHIRQLREMLPICSFCKKVRNDDGYWDSIEQYICEHTGTEFSHSVCPECMREHYPDIAQVMDEEDAAAERAALEQPGG